MLSLKRVEGPWQIDNSDIVLGVNGCTSDEFELRRMLEEGQDYVLVSQEVWEKLFEWYSFFFPFLYFLCFSCYAFSGATCLCLFLCEDPAIPLAYYCRKVFSYLLLLLLLFDVVQMLCSFKVSSFM